MSLRESINQHKSLTAVVALLVPATAVAMFWHSNVAARNAIEHQTLAWYSDDDGKTWFAEDRRTAIPPFDHNGKKAYRAYVFTGDSGKTQFVGWLEGYTPAAVKQLEYARDEAKNGVRAPGLFDVLRSEGVMCKKPGSGAWLSENDTRANAIRNITCPDGKTPQPVLP